MTDLLLILFVLITLGAKGALLATDRFLPLMPQVLILDLIIIGAAYLVGQETKR